jgi:uncharacterized protein YqeY
VNERGAAANGANRAAAEEREAELIEAYLPAELADDELESIADDAVAESGATGPSDMGKAMGAAMGKVAGRADGRRVSEAVRARLANEAS